MLYRGRAPSTADPATPRTPNSSTPTRRDGPSSSVTIEPSVEAGPQPAFATLERDGTTIDVTVNRSVVGRSSTADVHLAGDDVSRQHALVWREAGAVWIADLGSSNGTFINGEPVTDVIDLIDGDRLTFGESTYLLRIL